MEGRPKVLCMADLSLAPEAMEILKQAIDLDYRPPDRHVLLESIADYDAYWGHLNLKVDREVLDRASRLRAVVTATTGTDHIDKEECARRGIAVLSITEDYGLLESFTATAECAWMLMLGCHRHLRSAMRDALAGIWAHESRLGKELSRLTLGVLGVGRLGRMVVEYGKAFRMKVLGCDRRPFSLPGVESVDFDSLLRRSDAISIHIHLTPENRHLFNADTFAKLKDGAVLVNTSRGDIVDEAALLTALDTGKLAAYGADVVHDEWRADMRQSALVAYAQTHENVLLTPHMGGRTRHGISGARVFTARKLVHFLQTGEKLSMP